MIPNRIKQHPVILLMFITFSSHALVHDNLDLRHRQPQNVPNLAQRDLGVFVSLLIAISNDYCRSKRSMNGTFVRDLLQPRALIFRQFTFKHY